MVHPLLMVQVPVNGQHDALLKGGLGVPAKIKNDLGWYPETPFEKGIVLTIDWYLAHEEWMDHVTSGNYQKYYEQMYKNK